MCVLAQHTTLDIAKPYLKDVQMLTHTSVSAVLPASLQQFHNTEPALLVADSLTKPIVAMNNGNVDSCVNTCITASVQQTSMSAGTPILSTGQKKRVNVSLYFVFFVKCFVQILMFSCFREL